MSALTNKTRDDVIAALRKSRDTFEEWSRQLTWLEADLVDAVRFYHDRSFAEEHLRKAHAKAAAFTSYAAELIARIEAERTEVAA